jgi:cephalosporin hydroxylase
MNHFYESVEGYFSFKDVYAKMVEEATDGCHFVEVGAWKGRSTAFMAVEIINSGKDIKFDVVDNWIGSSEHQSDQHVRDKILFDVFQKNIQQVADRITVVRKDSVDAADEYANNSLDFVFIDAAHDFDSVNEDIKAWLPKVKVGGYIGGDDYDYFGVKQAVHHNFDEKDIVSMCTYPSWLYKKRETDE